MTGYILWAVLGILTIAEINLIYQLVTLAKRLSEMKGQLESVVAAVDTLDDKADELDDLVELQRQTLAEKSKAFVDYADTAASAAAHEVYTKQRAERTEALTHLSDAVDRTLADVLKRLEKLESGMVPDYEAALEAARAVNDFNTGLSAIMNFDPMAEAKKARNKATATGGERYGI